MIFVDYFLLPIKKKMIFVDYLLKKKKEKPHRTFNFFGSLAPSVDTLWLQVQSPLSHSEKESSLITFEKILLIY